MTRGDVPAVRLLLMLSAIAFAAMLPLGQSITLDVPVENLSRAVSELSQAARIGMRVQGDIAGEVVFLHLHGLPLREAMDGLARVTAGKWFTGADGTSILVRSKLPGPDPHDGLQGGDLTREIPVPQPSAATRAFWARQGPVGPKTTDAGFEQYLTDPVDYEPLALGNQELLSALAASTHKSMIACLPDRGAWMGPGWTDFGVMGPPPKTRVSIREYAENHMPTYDDGLACSETSDLIELRPHDFSRNVRIRADRAAMAVCVADFQKRGWIDFADYARAIRPHGYTAQVFLFLIDQFWPVEAPDIQIPEQPQFTTLLAELSRDQLSRLRAAATLSASDLSPHQRSLIQELLLPGQRAGARSDAKVRLTCDDRIEHFVQAFDAKQDKLFPIWADFLEHPYFGPVDAGPPPSLPRDPKVQITFILQPIEILVLKCSDSAGREANGRFFGACGPKSKPALLAALPPATRQKLEPIVAKLRSRDKSKS